ncbi:serine hydrolase [Agaribacterium haliotis]|uniref:serine hydrolase n=1 Tax=Agaribacterium haliotis TaxID=2013869 RepID=UPI001864A24D|nr:serine hydrolase [Agaribacterium haliotis]
MIKNSIVFALTNFTTLTCLLSTLCAAYPLDGYEDTGIRRVEGYRLMSEGKVKGPKEPIGARLNTSQVQLRLNQQQGLTLPDNDEDLAAAIIALLGEKKDDYGIAVLDLSDPEQPSYAEYNADYKQNVGSVGKLVVALGFFQALADAYPNDIDKREQILKNTIVTADAFSQRDIHPIKVYDVEAQVMHRQPMKIGNTGNLWEYLDWMLSVSSNAAASMMMRESLLLRHFGKDYPLSNEKIHEFFKQTPRSQLTELYKRTFWQPVTDNGLDIEQLRQGSFFTSGGNSALWGGGNSYGTAKALMHYSLKLEQGLLVDSWSSLQIKRLLYVTEHRIRYASSPALYRSAVYFKSGSLYSCKKEEGFHCGKYMGNIKNYMNSVAIVESPAGTTDLFYIVTLISNVLKKNSAVDHQTLATRIHRLIEKRHAPPSPKPTAKPSSKTSPTTEPGLKTSSNTSATATLANTQPNHAAEHQPGPAVLNTQLDPEEDKSPNKTNNMSYNF